VGLAGPAISQRIETRTSTVVTTLPPKTIRFGHYPTSFLLMW
jgi:hypothetical protein